MTMTFDGSTGITFPDGQTQTAGIPAPGASGNVVTSNGTVWVSTAPSSNGAALTDINASNLTSGTVATARLASGTANSSTYLRGDQTWAALSAPNNGVLTLNTSGTGLSGSQTFSADQASNVTFTVTSNANSANGASTIVARDSNGSFSANAGSFTSLSGSGAGLTGIPNSALTNSAITINGTSTALGGSISVGTVTSVNATAGTGISVSGGPITSSGSLTITNTGVTSLAAGTGISVSGATGGVTVTNAGVTSLAAGSGISLSGSTGGVTISATGGGTVTSVATGNGLSGGTITTSGTLTVACPTALSVGSYSMAYWSPNSTIASNANGTGWREMGCNSINPIGGGEWGWINDQTFSGTWKNMNRGTLNQWQGGLICRVS